MINIYTDGSCIENKSNQGGWAYIMVKDDFVISDAGRCYKNATNNRMELTACKMALKKLMELNLNQEGSILYTDSQYAINAIHSQKELNFNQDLVKDIKDLLCFIKIEFKWIKSHSGNFWNETADYMAKTKARGFKL